MLVEVARFWASVTSWDETEERYRILGVMGPDEFHDRYPWREEPGLDDNAYTNVMAAWVLGRAAEALETLAPARRAELCRVLGIGEDEPAAWRRIAARMRVPFLEDGIIAQFQDYDRLEELDWDAYRARYGDIHRLDRILEAEGDTINRYKASKQADVLMLFYLFSSAELRELLASMGYAFDPDSIPRNIDYYLRRTSHGSTLSRVVHSWVLARSDRARSWELLVEALESDLLDIQGGTTAEGIHLGAMAGSVDLIQRGQTALEFTDHTLSLSPCLPQEMQGLHLKFLYRGYWLHVDLDRDQVTISAPHGWAGPRQIDVRGKSHDFEPGETLSFTCHLEEEGWRPRHGPPERSKDLVLAETGPNAPSAGAT
jgi:trehalose/maltose hydrolase-like predicted phosphorylase